MEVKKNILLIIGVIVVVLIVVFSIKYLPPAKSSYLELNEEKIECYENSLYFIFNDANITSEELNVQNVRCSQEIPYWQWEMNGTYFENNDHSKEPKPFYFHEIRGGMAASGADTYYEVCLIIDNQKIISKIQIGRNWDYQSPARCLWQSNLP